MKFIMKQGLSKNFYPALATLIGYIIGVGMFGLPFLVSKAGVLTFFVFLALVVPVQYLLHLIYANIIIVTPGFSRLPGYAERYLGKKSKGMVMFAGLIGGYGALLAYVIITGVFLNELLQPYFGGDEFTYATIAFALEALIIYLGLKMIAKAELIMTGLLLLAIVLITWRGFPSVDINNFSGFDWRYIFLPYGAMLMALDGGGALPMVTNLLNKNKDEIKKVIRIGTFVPAVVVITFTLVITGISGNQTSPDALMGVKQVLSDGVITFSLIFGILAMVTSFLGVSETMIETFCWDYKMNRKLSFFISVFVPYGLYLAGLKNLTAVISFAGAVAGGFSAIILILIFMKLKKQEGGLVLFKRQPYNFVNFLLVGLFIIGIIYEVYYFVVS